MIGIHDTSAKLAGRICDRFHPLTKALEHLDSLSAEFDQIPSPPTCLGCGSQTDKALVDYEHDYKSSGDTRITIARALPGYRCGNCHAESRDPRLSDAFLENIAAGFAAAGDTRLQESLRKPRMDPRTIGVITDHRRALSQDSRQSASA